MFQWSISQSWRPIGVFSVGLYLCSIPTSSLLAQDQDEAEDADTIEEIIVTGSRIKRRDFTSLSPIATIDRNAIEFSGQATLEETLNQMPQVIPDANRTANAIGDGTSRINLRGMGAGRTLVLLNSRRIAPSGTGSAVDVNNLPQVLVERVEIITGGATTVYGSDAVAGVVNFITRDDFAGLALEANAYTTSENDSNIYDINLAYGFDLGDRGNITVYADIYDREELFGSEREISRFFWFTNPFTGSLVSGGSTVPPNGAIQLPLVDFGNGPARTIFDENGLPREFLDPDDRYNFAPINYLQTPLERFSVGLIGSIDLAGGYEMYIESAFSNNEAAHTLAEVPAVFFANVNTDNPVLEPATQQFFVDNFESSPGIASVVVRRRLTELGQRIIDYDRDYWRTVVGARGELGDGWDIDGWFTYTKSEETQRYLNDASASRLTQGLLVDPVTGQCFDTSNGCVPVNIFGPGRVSPEAQDFIRISDVQNTTDRTQMLASVFVTGSPFDTWAGPFDMAIGLEWRNDDASFVADDVLFTGDTLGFAGEATVSGEESVVEAYAEALVPLLKDVSLAKYLGLEVGARYSDYDNAGGVDTYKFGGEWLPMAGVRFRGMHQKSVRAPNNQELFQENFTGTGNFGGAAGETDPCSSSNDPVGTGNTDKCVLQGLPVDQVGIFQASPGPTNFVGGGNPNLIPEEAETTTLGLVITPDAWPGWSFSIDYFDIEITDSIGPIDAVSICFDPRNTANLFCDNITRDPDPLGAAGNVIEIFEPVSNRGVLGTDGIDTLVSWHGDLPDAFAILDGGAHLGFDFVWTHVISYEWQQTPFSETFDCAGNFGGFCDIGVSDQFGWTIPENRASTNVNYANGPLQLHLTWRWIEGTKSSLKNEYEFFGFPEPMLAIEDIGSKSYFDLGIGYDFSESLRGRIGISNLFDTDPPFMAEGGSIANTDPGLYDVFGRSFYISVSLQLGP